MICEHCKQRHATVTVTQVVNGQKAKGIIARCVHRSFIHLI